MVLHRNWWVIWKNCMSFCMSFCILKQIFRTDLAMPRNMMMYNIFGKWELKCILKNENWNGATNYNCSWKLGIIKCQWPLASGQEWIYLPGPPPPPQMNKQKQWYFEDTGVPGNGGSGSLGDRSKHEPSGFPGSLSWESVQPWCGGQTQAGPGELPELWWQRWSLAWT